MTTYAIDGYSEWQTMLTIGGERVKIHFTGGSVNQYGAIPAEYTTGDAAVQQALEATAYFKNGRIRRVSTAAVSDGVSTATDEPETDRPSVAAKELAFACIDDAALYLMEEYGYEEEAVIAAEDIAAVAAKHNLKITF